jgi:hypothetical protein
MAMDDKDELDISLSLPLSPQSRKHFTNELWNFDIDANVSQNRNVLPTCYFRYQEEQNRLAIYNDRYIGSTATYRDIVKIIHELCGEDLDRDTLRARYQETFEKEASDTDSSPTAYDDSDECIDHLVDLAVRLWVMIPIGGFRQVSLPGTSLNWQKGSLQDALAAQFEPGMALKESIPLGKVFNAHNLEQIGGIRIIWTSNLADHLRVQDDPTRVSIFHHAAFLNYHREVRSQIFPSGFVDETLQTLALLLPCHDRKVKSWYQKQMKRFTLDENAIKGGPLKTDDRNLDKFKYWSGRLEILKDIFDDAEPSTILQWWQDRRRRVQWYTFWVAVLVLVLTIFFGVIQCVEGGMQVYKAYHPS